MVGGRRFHLQQDIAHLGAVAVHDDQFVALAHDLHHQLGRFLGVAVLFLGRALFAGLQHGVAAEGDQSKFISHFLQPQKSGRPLPLGSSRPIAEQRLYLLS